MTQPRFDIIGARVEPFAAVPLIALRLRVAVSAGERIEAIALRTQIQIDPRRRHYTAGEESRLAGVFGDRTRWGDTLQSLLWTQISTMIPAFSGETEADLLLPCTYDFDVAANTYLDALRDGDIPLRASFSGTIFTQNAERRLWIEMISWENDARYGLPSALWREAMDAYFPNSAWLRVHRDTFDRLHHFKRHYGMRTWEETLDKLFELSGERL